MGISQISGKNVERKQLEINQKNNRLTRNALIVSTIFNVIFVCIAASNLLIISEEKPVETVLDNIDSSLLVTPLFTDKSNITYQTVTIILNNRHKERSINDVNFTLKFPSFCSIEALNFQSNFMNTVTPIIHEGKNENGVSMGDFSIDSDSSANLRILVTWSENDNSSKYIKPFYSLSVVEDGIKYNEEPEVYID